MKRIIILIAITSLVGSLAVSSALAQRMQGPGGYGYGQGFPRTRMYEPTTAETLNGQVISVDRMTPATSRPMGGRGRGGGIHLLVKANDQTVEVHLGPSWYLDDQNFTIAPGDRIEIKGSRVSTPRGEFLIASQVKKGNEILTLRNEDGFPAWSGQGRRW